MKNRKAPSSRNIASYLVKALEAQDELDITSVEAYAYPKGDSEQTHVFQVDRDIELTTPNGGTVRRTWRISVSLVGTEVVDPVKP